MQLINNAKTGFILGNRRGNTYILSCVVVIFISSLLSVLLVFSLTVAEIYAQRDKVKSKIDAYLSKVRVENTDFIKNYNGEFVSEEFLAELEQNALSALGFTDNVSELDYGNGSMSRPTITAYFEKGIILTVQYDLKMKIPFFSWISTETTMPVDCVTANILVTAKLLNKNTGA